MDLTQFTHVFFSPLRTRQLTTGSMPDDTKAPLVIGLIGSLLFTNLVLLGARLWSRTRPTYALRIEDWTVVGATVLTSVKFTLICLACSYGFGRHAEFVSAASRLLAVRLIFFCQVLWHWSIVLAKISVAAVLLRIKSTRAWRIFLLGTIVLLILTAMVSTLFAFLQCRPFTSFWNVSMFSKKGTVTCIPSAAITGNIIAGITVHVSIDLVFSFIPITFIRKLRRSRGEKIVLSVLMGLGLFASAFAILRTAGIHSIYRSQDRFRASVMPMLWSMLELQIALMAATIPTLKNYMHHCLVRIVHYFSDQCTDAQIQIRLEDLGFLGRSDGISSNKGMKQLKSNMEW
ncbi:hypothetical protein EJ02DRAFT_378256 [Clathrospora elynae]|uniref:Rhodopsin domain-containing protein n=1 Tax=Clathrospora elynae TaxID=706981 RepID=A0A6A5SNF2_9PLEO|nr:hypothetical protein EJ02DRAFT_378256 [Clathrospora elynae]